jgi:hypothetical protein
MIYSYKEIVFREVKSKSFPIINPNTDPILISITGKLINISKKFSEKIFVPSQKQVIKVRIKFNDKNIIINLNTNNNILFQSGSGLLPLKNFVILWVQNLCKLFVLCNI